jgi:hypothetical protein
MTDNEVRAKWDDILLDFEARTAHWLVPLLLAFSVAAVAGMAGGVAWPLGIFES